MSDERQALRTRREGLMDKALAWVRSTRRFQRAINVGSLIGVLMLSVGSGMAGDIISPANSGGGVTIKGLVIVFGGFIGLVGGVAAMFLQDEAPALLKSASELERDAQKFLDEREALKAEQQDKASLDLRRLALIDAQSVMRETLELTLLEAEATEAQAVETMLDAAKLHLCKSIGLQAGEAWAISVFRIRANGNGSRLSRIAALRAETLDPRQQARDWGPNEGFVGAAWASNRDTIIEDSNDPRVAEDYPVPSALRRAYDVNRYRSMAAIPIRVGPDQKIWGVVAGSSDHVGRFHRDKENRNKQAVDTIRLIARMTALMAAAFKRSST